MAEKFLPAAEVRAESSFLIKERQAALF